MTFMKPINDWDFPIEMMPTPNAVTGEPVPNSVQVIRTDTNEVMGIYFSKWLETTLKWWKKCLAVL